MGCFKTKESAIFQHKNYDAKCKILILHKKYYQDIHLKIMN